MNVTLFDNSWSMEFHIHINYCLKYHHMKRYVFLRIYWYIVDKLHLLTVVDLPTRLIRPELRANLDESFVFHTYTTYSGRLELPHRCTV